VIVDHNGKQCIDESLPALLEKSWKCHGISGGLESGHPDGTIQFVGATTSEKVEGTTSSLSWGDVQRRFEFGCLRTC